jgi:hypothetical protein
MRPHQGAIDRRDLHLARTRKLSVAIAGGAAGATIVLATAFGYALPGHAVTSGAKAPAGQGGNGSSRTGSGHAGRRQLTPPAQPPASSPAPPVVSSGGS